MVPDSATADDYGDPMSRRLLGLAADVLRSFGSAFGGRHLAIIGGAAPSLLVNDVPFGMESHVGTADLDFHLSLHLLDGETADYYQAIIDGLRELGLRPDTAGGRAVNWRWLGQHRGVHLQVEFLCPVRSRGGRPEAPAANTPAEANIGPSGEITALAVGFGHLVPIDTVIVERRVETSRGNLSYEFPVAGLASWLCLKADAIMRRDKPKDAYDVVWVIAALGPEVAAQRVIDSPLLDGDTAVEVIEQLRRLHEQFSTVEAVGPRGYADFLQDPENGAARRFAQGAVIRFWNDLQARLNGG
jgi:Nucleotidyl transferase AbiEii toxin, Type IV TA system